MRLPLFERENMKYKTKKENFKFVMFIPDSLKKLHSPYDLKRMQKNFEEYAKESTQKERETH